MKNGQHFILDLTRPTEFSEMNFRKHFLILLTIFLASHDGVRGRTTHYSPGYKTYLMRNQVMCDGEENLKSDLGIISFALGWVSSVAGLFSLTEFSVPSNNISIISTILGLILWVPSALHTFFATSGPVNWTISNLVNLGSLIVTYYGGIGIFTGTADILISSMDEVLGITSLIISALTTFPDVYKELKELFQEVLGKEEVDQWIQSYGCENEFAGGGRLGFMREFFLG